VLKDELCIGDVHVRVFNQLGLEKGASRDIHNPNGFAKQLTDFITKCINASQDLLEDWVRLSVSHKQQEDPESETKEPILNSVSIADWRFLLVITALG
jgi:hypothetical protein